VSEREEKMEDDSFESLDGMPQGPQLSFLAWLFRSLGLRYRLLLPFLAVVALVLAALAIWKFKTPALTAVLLVVVPLPLFYGAISFFDGLISAYQIIMLSSVTPKPSEFADATAASIVGVQVGAILSLPVYFLATFALCYRALTHSEAIVPAEPAIGATFSKAVK
jgi:hypothetical protein